MAEDETGGSGSLNYMTDIKSYRTLFFPWGAKSGQQADEHLRQRHKYVKGNEKAPY